MTPGQRASGRRRRRRGPRRWALLLGPDADNGDVEVQIDPEVFGRDGRGVQALGERKARAVTQGEAIVGNARVELSRRSASAAVKSTTSTWARTAVRMASASRPFRRRTAATSDRATALMTAALSWINGAIIAAVGRSPFVKAARAQHIEKEQHFTAAWNAVHGQPPSAGSGRSKS